MPESPESEKPVMREELNQALKLITNSVNAHIKKSDEELKGIREQPLKTLCPGIEDIAKSAVDKIATARVEEVAPPVIKKIIEEDVSGEEGIIHDLARPLIRYRNSTLIGVTIASVIAVGSVIWIWRNVHDFNEQMEEAQKLDSSKFSERLTSHIASGSQKINLLGIKLTEYSDSKSKELEQRLNLSSTTRENSMKKDLEAQISGLRTDVTSYNARIETIEKNGASLAGEQKANRAYLEDIRTRLDEFSKQYVLLAKKEDVNKDLSELKKNFDLLNKQSEELKLAYKRIQEMDEKLKGYDESLRALHGRNIEREKEYAAIKSQMDSIQKAFDNYKAGIKPQEPIPQPVPNN